MATRTHIVEAGFVEPPFIKQSAKRPFQKQVRHRRSKKNATTTSRRAPLRADAQAEPSAATHFAILQLGVSIWNQWRASEPLTRPNLRNANLSGFHLENINFCRVDLRGANLSSAYLYEADFQEANLRRANFTRAGLIGANLHKAIASGANFQNAYLAQSDLSNANFTKASLQKADLQAALVSDTIFAKANIAETELIGSFDLTKAQLESARNVHLACFDDALRTALNLEPNELTANTATDKMNATKPANTTKEVGVFQPTHEPTASKPALRKLAVS